MSKYPAQRVGVFVDVSNMYYSARALYQSRVNFQAILEEAVGERQLVRALAYVIKAEAPEEQAFFDALTKQGWEVRQKDLQVFVGGAKKGDWDVGIAMDVLRLAPKLDVVVLVSGDGDYAELVKYVKALGTRVEAMAFGPSTSKLLVQEVDDFRDLAADTNRFVMGTNRSRPPHPQTTGTYSNRKDELPPLSQPSTTPIAAINPTLPPHTSYVPRTPAHPQPLSLDDVPTIKAPMSSRSSRGGRRRSPRVTI